MPHTSYKDKFGKDELDRIIEVEDWRPIPGYETFYEVSSWGRVRSLDRVITRSDGKTRRWKGRVLKFALNTHGYPACVLSTNSRVQSVVIHQLVMRVFVGDPPNGMEVCHEDGSRGNARIDNLRYDTRKANHADKHKHDSHRLGERTPNSILTSDDVRAIRGSREYGSAQRHATEYGVHIQTIYDVYYRRTWDHI